MRVLAFFLLLIGLLIVAAGVFVFVTAHGAGPVGGPGGSSTEWYEPYHYVELPIVDHVDYDDLPMWEGAGVGAMVIGAGLAVFGLRLTSAYSQRL